MPAVALLLLAVLFLVRPPVVGNLEVTLVAFLATFGLTAFVRTLASRSGALDYPDARKKHAVPTPKLGGVAVLAGFVLALGRRPLFDAELLTIAVCALALMLAGALDDTRGLSSRVRLALQLIAALVIIGAGVRLNLLPGPRAWSST